MTASPTWSSLSREASIAAEHLAIGATALRRANNAPSTYYVRSFFAFTVGLELPAKLAAVVDHTLTFGVSFAGNSEVRKFDDGVRELLCRFDSIAVRRSLDAPKGPLPRSPDRDGILESAWIFRWLRKTWSDSVSSSSIEHMAFKSVRSFHGV